MDLELGIVGDGHVDMATVIVEEDLDHPIDLDGIHEGPEHRGELATDVGEGLRTKVLVAIEVRQAWRARGLRGELAEPCPCRPRAEGKTGPRAGCPGHQLSARRLCCGAALAPA